LSFRKQQIRIEITLFCAGTNYDILFRSWMYYTQFQKDRLLIKSVLQSFAKRLKHVINIKRCCVIAVNSFIAEHMETS